MLSKPHLMKMLVDVVTVGDAAILSEDRNLTTEICAFEDRETVRRMVSIVSGILRSFDYTSSPEFEEELSGKSSAVVAMKKRLAGDAMRRTAHRHRFESALGELLSSNDAFALAPLEQHEDLRTLVELAGNLQNPSADMVS